MRPAIVAPCSFGAPKPDAPATASPTFSHRLVLAERLGNTVRQRTLLNLGRHFDIPQPQWPLLCARVADALAGQTPLVADCPPAVDEEAQRIAAQLVARGASLPAAGPADVQPGRRRLATPDPTP